MLPVVCSKMGQSMDAEFMPRIDPAIQVRWNRDGFILPPKGPVFDDFGLCWLRVRESDISLSNQNAPLWCVTEF